MQVVRLQKLVDRVTILQTSGSGVVTPVTLCVKDGKKRKKKRSSMPLRGMETIAERAVQAQKAFADTLSKRFESSQRKKSDGWLMDMGKNVFRAAQKAGKRIRVLRTSDD
jgi:Family of unknown function (DUF6312)